MIHVFHTPTGWKVCQEYPDEPDYIQPHDTNDHDIMVNLNEKWKGEYIAAVALSIANAVDIREEDWLLVKKNVVESVYKNGQIGDATKVITSMWQPESNHVYALPELEMEIKWDKCKSAVCELNECCWFELFQHYKEHPEEYQKAKAAGKKMRPMMDDNGNELVECNTHQLAHVFRKKEESDGQTNLEQYHDATGRITREEFDKMEESQEDLWVEVAYNFSITREFKDAYKTLQSKFHLTRVKAELKGEKK